MFKPDTGGVGGQFGPQSHEASLSAQLIKYFRFMAKSHREAICVLGPL